MEDGALVAVVDAGNGDGELDVLHLVGTDADGVAEMAGQKEESYGVFCEVLVRVLDVICGNHTKSSFAE